MNILIADDDERILRMLKDYLEFNKYTVITANNGEEAINYFKSTSNIDLIILDVMMPIYDGWIVCKEIRKSSNVPIIMLTAKDSDLDELFGFDIGVDDYISKPFNIALLLARVKRLLKDKTNNEVKNNLLQFKEISIDLDKHAAFIDKNFVDLSPKEYELLLYMMNNINIAIRRESFVSNVWGSDYYGDTRTLDTHINRLRIKLGSYAKYIKTVRGYGYKIGE